MYPQPQVKLLTGHKITILHQVVGAHEEMDVVGTQIW